MKLKFRGWIWKCCSVRVQCYNHNFLRFLTIFDEKNWRFSQKPMLWSQFSAIFDKFRRKDLVFFSKTNVMITIFCDFWQISTKKLAVFSKTNVMIKILHNLALFRVKHASFFADFFGENIFKIITSVTYTFSCPSVCRKYKKS
jgi:hypothetical protein